MGLKVPSSKVYRVPLHESMKKCRRCSHFRELKEGFPRFGYECTRFMDIEQRIRLDGEYCHSFEQVKKLVER